ncbi:hypothetical protein PQI07_16475 [Methylobacterium sp. 092160098-2]|uniref:hypothetical protein n=1 Tax=Methylobacterium sp. 092160098-2 TaxID=3025129 RepID=UPI0023819A2F|nr:hypothetical protein [Methylobacterium sp. 092160098-2]MDE4912278.1 hypothetical protein [Methylobacterium sp. 092160098-2]
MIDGYAYYTRPHLFDVYWHTRKRQWSVRVNGRVLYHASQACLSDVTLVVSVAAVERIRAKGQREVCAWARGNRQYLPHGIGTGERLFFDPYRHTSFVTAGGMNVTRCRRIYFDPDGSAWGIECR